MTVYPRRKSSGPDAVFPAINRRFVRLAAANAVRAREEYGRQIATTYGAKLFPTQQEELFPGAEITFKVPSSADVQSAVLNWKLYLGDSPSLAVKLALGERPRRKVQCDCDSTTGGYQRLRRWAGFRGRVLTNMTKLEKIRLNDAFAYADEYVLLNTSCQTLSDISNGFCDVWAKAVKRKAPFVEIREWMGHWFVVFDGVAYDSDTSEQGFQPPS